MGDEGAVAVIQKGRTNLPRADVCFGGLGPAHVRDAGVHVRCEVKIVGRYLIPKRFGAVQR